MRDPVITVDDQTYEGTEIEKWFDLGNRTNPLTGETVTSTISSPISHCAKTSEKVGCFDRRVGQVVPDLVLRGVRKDRNYKVRVPDVK
jgi:hypothetical protein